MGWGTTFKPEIYLSKKSFESDYDLEDEISENEMHLTSIEKEILMLASANPKDICGEEFKDEPLSFVKYRIEELMDSYAQTMTDLTNLRHFREHLEETQEDIEDYNPFKEFKE